MASDPEKELQEFLASQPEPLQRALHGDYSLLTLQQKLEFWDSDLDERYKQLVEQIPEKFRAYQKQKTRELLGDFSFMVPKAKLGRKANDDLAKRIWALDAEGKTNREIQQIVNADYENQKLSLEGVEYYLKHRRRSRGGS